MGSIQIREMYGLATIQDFGRRGYQAMGIPLSGAMDRLSMIIANKLVGNLENTGLIEIALHGGTLVFDGHTSIAITGADFQYRLNEIEVPMYETIEVKKGDVLRGGASISGMYGYIAVAEGFKMECTLGSQSTYMKSAIGGHCGRRLKKGDVLTLNGQNNRVDKRFFRREQLDSQSLSVKIGVIPHPDFEANADDFRRYFGVPYKIQTSSDRMGLRLEGEPIVIKSGYDILSSPVTFGTIQVPASGQPMVLTADSQTTGGYFVMGTVCLADLSKMVQSPYGSVIEFELINIREAQGRLKQELQIVRDCIEVSRAVKSKEYKITIKDHTYLVSVEEII